MSKVICELKNITFSNDNYTIFDNLSLKICESSFNSVIGISGSGKSTLLKLLSGLIIPDKGQIKIYDMDINHIKANKELEIRKKIGFVFQDTALLSNLSIKDNLLLPLLVHYSYLSDKKREEMVDEVLDLVKFHDSPLQRPAQLSFGEKKIVAFARAIITEPEILFLDEPVTSIDSTIKKTIIKIIDDYNNKSGKTVIIATYDKDIIHNFSDNLIFLDEEGGISLQCKYDKCNFQVDNLSNNLFKDIFDIGVNNEI